VLDYHNFVILLLFMFTMIEILALNNISWFNDFVHFLVRFISIEFMLYFLSVSGCILCISIHF